MHSAVLLPVFFINLVSMVCIVDLKVIWTVSTEPVVIGGNLRLFCNTSGSSCSNCTRRWLKERQLLYLHDTVTDEIKYAIEQQKNGFTLVIKNVTIDDFDTEYECSYSYERFRKTLTLPSSFEYQPRMDTLWMNCNVTHGKLLLDVDFTEIHPIPVCSIYLDEEKLLNVKEEAKKKGYLYQVMMHLNHTVNPDQYEGRLLVTCVTGTKEDTIVNDPLSFACSGGRDLAKNELLAFMIIISTVICVVIIVVAAFCVLKHNNLCMKPLANCSSKCKISRNKKESNVKYDANENESREEML